MKTLITAAFDSFENADKAIGKLKTEFADFNCMESGADLPESSIQEQFVVPVSIDFFRFAVVSSGNNNKRNTSSRALVRFVENKAEKDRFEKIEKIIKKCGGKICRSAYAAENNTAFL